MSVKTRLVVSIVAVLTVALGGLVAVIATLATGQAQRDGLRNATAVAVEQARQVEADLGRQRSTAESLAQALAAQTDDPDLAGRFAPLAERLAEQEETIVGELNGVQGEPVDLGGYYFVDRDKATEVMRPSETFNAALAAF